MQVQAARVNDVSFMHVIVIAQYLLGLKYQVFLLYNNADYFDNISDISLLC